MNRAELEGFKNVVEGQVTATNEGEVSLRGKKRDPDECIDAAIPNGVHLEHVAVDQVRAGNGDLLTDHFAISGVLS